MPAEPEAARLVASPRGAIEPLVHAPAIVRHGGRRPSLATGYGVAACGAVLIVLATLRGAIPLLFAGFFLFGGATAGALSGAVVHAWG